MSEIQTTIRPLNRLNEHELQYVIDQAQADGHATIGITHVVERNKELIGHLSVCGVPSVLIWMHTQRAKSRDGLRVMDFYENRIRDTGANSVIVPCVKDSPLYKYMEAVGYVKGSDATLFFKNLG